eukprot:936743_1
MTEITLGEGKDEHHFISAITSDNDRIYQRIEWMSRSMPLLRSTPIKTRARSFRSHSLVDSLTVNIVGMRRLSAAKDDVTRTIPLFVYLCVLLACMNSLNTGYDIGIIGSAIIYIEQDLNINNTQIQFLVASANASAIFGSLFGGQIAFQFGRRRAIIFTAVLSCIAVLCMAASPYFSLLIAARVINGLTMGMSFSVTPLYIAELVPAQIRGSMVTLCDLSMNIGHVLGYVIGFVFVITDVPPSTSWRVMVASGAAVSCLLALSMCFMPESPRWLNQNGYTQKARDIITKTATSAEQVDVIMLDMEHTNHMMSKQDSIGWKQIMLPCVYKIGNIAAKRSLLIGIPVTLMNSACGIIIFVYYTPKILQENGFSKEGIYLGTIFVGISKLIVLGIASQLMDIVGRRSLLLTSAIVMCIATACLGTVVQFESDIEYSHVYILALLLVITGAFSFGYGPVPFVICSEIFPLNIRSKAVGFCVGLNRLGATLVSLTFFSFQSIFQRHGVYYIYTGIGVLNIIFIYWKVFETKSKSLEQITKILTEQ